MEQANIAVFSVILVLWISYSVQINKNIKCIGSRSCGCVTCHILENLLQISWTRSFWAIIASVVEYSQAWFHKSKCTEIFWPPKNDPVDKIGQIPTYAVLCALEEGTHMNVVITVLTQSQFIYYTELRKGKLNGSSFFFRAAS